MHVVHLDVVAHLLESVPKLNPTQLLLRGKSGTSLQGEKQNYHDILHGDLPVKLTCETVTASVIERSICCFRRSSRLIHSDKQIGQVMSFPSGDFEFFR